MRILLFLILSFSANVLAAQDTLIVKPDTLLKRIELDSIEESEPDSLSLLEPLMTELTIKGKVYPAMITEDGDTIIIAEDILYVSITSMRKFSSDEEYRKYRKFRRYANKVYPYAKEAIRIFRELEYADAHLSKKEKKKKIKELNDQLKEEFEAPLKKLTKLQGKIMIKMIERELDEPVYNLIKGLKGRFTAFYWHNFSKLYSYDLKEGYNVGKYPILDAVLQDFDISYKIEYGTDLKYVKLEKD
jgi:hypothetical protein